MRECHTESSTTSKTVQNRQGGKIDELFCLKVPQQYKDKSLVDLTNQQELKNIDLIPSMELLAEGAVHYQGCG